MKAHRDLHTDHDFIFEKLFKAVPVDTLVLPGGRAPAAALPTCEPAGAKPAAKPAAKGGGGTAQKQQQAGAMPHQPGRSQHDQVEKLFSWWRNAHFTAFTCGRALKKHGLCVFRMQDESTWVDGAVFSQSGMARRSSMPAALGDSLRRVVALLPQPYQ